VAPCPSALDATGTGPMQIRGRTGPTASPRVGDGTPGSSPSNRFIQPSDVRFTPGVPDSM
jgi:hypothetical protein